MRTGGEECVEPLRGKRDGIRPRDACGIKALRTRGIEQRRLERSRRQKSRLA
jgi:hypothetical protein